MYSEYFLFYSIFHSDNFAQRDKLDELRQTKRIVKQINDNSHIYGYDGDDGGGSGGGDDGVEQRQKTNNVDNEVEVEVK